MGECFRSADSPVFFRNTKINQQEEKNPGVKVQDAKAVKLYAQVPPIDKMDGALSQLKECE